MSRQQISRKLLVTLALLSLMGSVLSCGGREASIRAWIDWPLDGASVPVGSTVSVISHAYAREGVAEVMLSVEGQPYRRDASPQAGATFLEVTQEWRPEVEGVYTLQVTTYAANGETSSPATVSVSVVGAVAELPTSPTVNPTPTWTPIIPVPVTPTLTPTPTSMTPTSMTPTPMTPTPITPTPITPTPVTPMPQADVRLWADNDQVQAGSCTTVRWHVSNVQAYWVDGQPGAGDDGSLRTCPCEQETHTLRARMQNGSEQNLSVTIRVTGQCVTQPPPQTPVPAPSPSTPQNGAELSCRSTVTLVWVPIEQPGGSVRYYVKLEQQRGGQWQSVRGWGPESGKQVEASVECGGSYRWAVRAQDGAGTYSEWSSWSRFTVAGQAPPTATPIPAPSPNTPQNGAELSCRSTVTLVWVPIEQPGGTVSYTVKPERRVLDNWQSLGVWGPTAGKQMEVPVECGYRYRWAVRAQDGAGEYSAWSSWFQFTVTMD